MNNHYHREEEIGSGAYGKVYRVRDYSGKSYAMKRIKNTNEGIPCLLEASIMASIRHPGLNNSINVFCTNSHLNIIQELAQSDIAKHTRRKIIPLVIVRKWLYIISSALYSLHRLGFVHGDIKGANVLYFNDDDVRLTDFTLSTRLWHKDDMFSVHAGTYSHCSPELLLGKIWNRSMDIWALGCTFYEIAFGKLLFNYQERNSDSHLMRLRYHNAIAEWLGESKIQGASEFIYPDNESMLNTQTYASFKDLLSSMLKYNPNERINIKQVLNHSFFDDMLPLSVKIKETQVSGLGTSELSVISRKVNKMLSPNLKKIGIIDMGHISTMTINIYIRCHGIYDDKVGLKDIILATCCWIASKLVIGISPILSTEIPTDRIRLMENQICNHLSYCLPINLDIVDL